MHHYICLNQIAQVGLERFHSDYVRTDQLSNAELVLVRSANMLETKLPQSVLAVARAGAGVNNIPAEEYAAQGTVVFNTPGANANGVKEMVIAGMLLSARDVVEGINWASGQKGSETVSKDAEKEKRLFAGTELAGKKLGVIGLGAIGILVANAATHLGMDVYGYDPYISVDAAWNLSRSIIHINEIDRIFSECDYVTIHVPLNEKTRGMISDREISMMKPTAVLLNYARDLLVDEQAVLNALDQGRLHRYVSDFPNTLTAGHPGVILSPHLGASTEESEINCAKMAVDELKDYLENGNIKNSVNYPACDLGVCTAEGRIGIFHKNQPSMITQFTQILGASDVNIAGMANKSKKEVAYTLIDFDSPVDKALVRKLSEVNGVYRVRIIK